MHTTLLMSLDVLREAVVAADPVFPLPFRRGHMDNTRQRCRLLLIMLVHASEQMFNPRQLIS